MRRIPPGLRRRERAECVVCVLVRGRYGVL